MASTSTPSTSEPPPAGKALNLSNLKVLVTGASSGIGRETCILLTAYGAKVVGTARSEQALQALQVQGGIEAYVAADLTQPGACERIVTEAVRLLNGQLTSVVNAAGVLQGGAMGQVDLANYQYNMVCNTQAPFEILCHAIPYLRQQSTQKSDNSGGGGTTAIVNISSVNGKQSFAGCATYCMSKAALDQLTRCASVDLAPYGIRVNSINPGVIATNLQLAGGMSAESYQAFVQRSIDTTHPLASHLGRVGQPREVAELVAFLLSDKSQFLTGECIALDGGRQNLGAR